MTKRLDGKYEDENVVIIGNGKPSQPITWRPINPLQPKIIKPKSDHRILYMWALGMFIMLVIIGLNGGKPLT